MTVLAMMEIAKKDTVIHNLNPIVKLIWVSCLIVTSIVSYNIFVSLAVLAIVWLLAIPAKLGSLFPSTMWKMYRIMIPIVMIVWILFYRKGEHVLINSGILFITRESILFALAQGLRIAAAITGCLYFVMVTETIDVSNGLGIVFQKVGISYTVPLMFTTAFKILPEFMTSYESIKESFLTRAFELDKGNFTQKIKNYIPLFVPLMDSSLGKAQNISSALQLRAFDSQESKKRTYLDEYTISLEDVLFLALGIGILAFAIFGEINNLGGFTF